jgi:hypothetical protein
MPKRDIPYRDQKIGHEIRARVLVSCQSVGWGNRRLIRILPGEDLGID